jgi:hypothetical protein
MYKITFSVIGQFVTNVSSNLVIPFAPENTDYQQFKKDIANGIELQDSNGQVMTGDALTQFMKGLP